MWDDGTEQIDHRTLYDRALETLCEPTQFSDGATYCKPATDEGFYTDDQCLHPIARVPTGTAPRPFIATTFGLAGALSVSRVYRRGALTDVPQQRWERRDNLCVAMPLDDGFDYYAAGLEVADLARVELGMADDYDELLLHHVTGDGVDLPWAFEDTKYGACDVAVRPTDKTTWCRPRAVEPIIYFEDNQCQRAIIVGAANPLLASEGNPDCPTYFQAGVDALTADLYQRGSGGCVQVPTSGPTRGALVGPQITLPTLDRTRSGTGRIKPITLSPTPLTDELVFDTGLGVDCRRDEQGRCIPASVAPVETWFADATCTQSVDVAIVAPSGCTSRFPHYARKADAFFDIGDVYGQQLYQLSTGDTCQTYNPPLGSVAHSLGAAVSDSAMARATLTIE